MDDYAINLEEWLQSGHKVVVCLVGRVGLVGGDEAM